MIRICPNPTAWHGAYQRLVKYANSHTCNPTSPPKALILNGWVFSNDVEKRRRWQETVAWADANECSDLIAGISDDDFYFVTQPTRHTVGPLGGPMYRDWDYETKTRPLESQLAENLANLEVSWLEIVGSELAKITRPLEFTGAKARRLLVMADGATFPPWGGWSSLSDDASKRRAFTRFRAAINNAITPHEVDHIDFTTKNANSHE